MQGEVSWLELSTPNARAAMPFYQRLFGWEEGPGEVDFPYHFLKQTGSDKNFGGIMPQTDVTVPPHWLVYFGVADLDAALRQVEELGGKVHTPPITIPSGKFAVVSDPHGANFALY